MDQRSPRLFRFPNGFELLVVPDRHAPVLALDLWVRVGSACERPDEAGMAHLVEHMLFKGTARRGPGEIAREVEGVGGEINAYTSFDHTVYTLTVASRFAGLGLDLLADAAFGSGFDPVELDREKQVVLEEIRRGRDLPQLRLSRLLFEQAYTRHPYGRPVIGREETVAGFTRDRCLEFVSRWYRPGNMTLVACGDARPGRLAERVAALFGTRGRSGRPRGTARLREPAPGAFRARFEVADVSETYWNLAFPGPSASHPDVAALDVLTTVVGQGEASRLQHRVKMERNLVRSVGAGAYTPRDPGLIHVAAVAEPGLAGDGFEAVCEELFRLAREPVGETELDRARRNVEADFVYQKETVQGQAQKAGFFHVVLGSVAAEEAYLASLRQVDARAVQRVARRYLRPDRAVLVALLPRAADGAWSEAAAAGGIDRAAAAARPARRSHGRRSGPVRRVLSAGTRVVLKVNPQVPVVAVRAAVLGGTLREPADRAGAFHLLAAALTHGTRGASVFQLAQRIDAVGGSLDGFSGRNSYGLRAEFLARHLTEGLDLFTEVLCHPTFPADEVAKVREDALAGIRLRRDNPASYAFRELEALLYGDHPYGRDVLGTPDAVAGLDAGFLRELHRAALRPDRLAVGVAGAIDPERVCAALEAALAGLTPGGDLPPLPSLPGSTDRLRLRHVEAPTEQAHVVVGFPGTDLRAPDRYALRVASGVLSGQGGRLFRRLRDEQGLAYAVTSTCVEGLHPGYVTGYIATAPDNVGAARDGLLREFERLAEERVPRDELARARRKLVGGFEIALQENQAQAAHMALDELYGLDGCDLGAYARGVLAVTADDVLAAVRRYLVPGRASVLVLGPTPS